MPASALTTSCGPLAAAPVHVESGSARAHLVDVTMFWSATGGGVGRYLRSKQAWAAAHAPGWRHTLVVPDTPASGRVRLPAPRLPFSHGYRFPLARRAVARRLARLAPDLIESGDPYRTAWSALDAGRQLGIPVVAFCHSNVEQLARRLAGSLAARAARAYLRRLYAEFDGVFAASAWMVGELRSLGVDRVLHQPLGVDTSTFHPRLAQADWRRQLGLSDRDTVLVYAGRFAPEKNLEVLAEAVRRLGPRHALVLIGAGPALPRGPRVFRLPYQSDASALATALASADAFVHAGDQETFGLAALEALACGTPVVACARAGLRDLVDQHTVIGVPLPRAERFAEAIAGLRPTLADLRDAARVRALQYDQRLTFDRQFARYAALCAGHAATGPRHEEAAHGA